MTKLQVDSMRFGPWFFYRTPGVDDEIPGEVDDLFEMVEDEIGDGDDGLEAGILACL